MKEISLVLSGGGIKGLAHVGLLAALQDHGIRVTSISGTSAGALVGALYGSGMTIDMILEFFKSYSIFQPFNFSLKKPGIFSTDRYKNILKATLKETFEELSISLYVCASDLMSGDPRYFDKGELVLPVLASCAVPLLFTPVQIGDRMYTDGGVSDNFPIDPLMINAEGSIWGSYVVKPFATEDSTAYNGYLKLTIRNNNMVMYHGNKQKFVATEHVFLPNMMKIPTFNIKSVDQAFNIGYAYAKSTLEKMGY